MSITYNIEINKDKIASFQDVITEVTEAMFRTGTKIISDLLERLDTAIRESVDTSRYRNKGKRKNTIKTRMGEVEYHRTIYFDHETNEYVYPLDDCVENNLIGLIDEDVVSLIEEQICTMSYRETAKCISKLTGISISHQGVWNIVQEAGRRRLEHNEELTRLNQKGQLQGNIETEILYEEADGNWLSLQGKDRKTYGPSKEMKIMIAYDGVTCTGIPNKKVRRKLDNKDSRYVMRITANDQVGKSYIKSFKAPSQKYPVIAVTSKLLSTGVDTQTVELIVIDKTIGSMSEFKQTIGRGTRIKENYKVGEEEKSKTHFTLMDFRKNYLKFDDPDFDGDIEIIDGSTSIPLAVNNKKKKRELFRIKDVNVEVAGHQIMYLDEDMKLVKEENIEECVKNNIVDIYPDYESFRKGWKETVDKKALINTLLLNQSIAERLMAESGILMDYYDLISFYGYGIPIPIKEERINRAKNYVCMLETSQKEIMDIVIECYRHTDFTDLRLIKIFSLAPFALKGYTTKTAIKPFGGVEGYEKVIDNMEEKIF